MGPRAFFHANALSVLDLESIELGFQCQSELESIQSYQLLFLIINSNI